MSDRHSLSRSVLIATIACLGVFGSDFARPQLPTRRRRPSSRRGRSRIWRPAKCRSRRIRRPTCSRSRRSSSTATSWSCSRSNEKMRTEAMRRLGDLQVEVDEAARAAGVDSGVEGMELKEAIQLYEGLLKSHPGLSAQRRRDVSAVARARSTGAARTGAGGARPTGRKISAEPVVHRSAVPSWRNSVQRRPLSRCRARLQRRGEGGPGRRFLRTGSVQARLVAVQAGSRRRKRRFLPEGDSIAC